MWDVGEGGCADGVVGWGRAEYRKEAEGAARDIDEDDSDTDIKKKRKRRERREGATAGKGYILDEHLAKWLDTVLDWKSWSENQLLDVMRDEVTAVVEADVFRQPIESSGTWDPDQLADRKSEAELFGELKRDLRAKCRSTLEAEIEEFDTKNLNNVDREALHKYKAARLEGAPIVAPPLVEDVRKLVREDAPYYMTLGFVKIFQTGEGDYWAFEHKRQGRGMRMTLWEWFQHILRHCSGRALRHPRFYYFAINTLLRNKAYRSKAFFIRRSFGGQAYEEVTPDKLLAMGKAQMSRILCAYEGNQPGSAAEKLAQRTDLEAMIHQLEEASGRFLGVSSIPLGPPAFFENVDGPG